MAGFKSLDELLEAASANRTRVVTEMQDKDGLWWRVKMESFQRDRLILWDDDLMLGRASSRNVQSRDFLLAQAHRAFTQVFSPEQAQALMVTLEDLTEPKTDAPADPEQTSITSDYPPKVDRSRREGSR